MSFNSGKEWSGGFTVIELLVVVAVIGLLSSVVLISVDNARDKARDARRLQDVKTLFESIQRYHLANNTLPGDGDTSGVQLSSECDSDFKDDLVQAGIMNQLPSDPSATDKCSVDGGDDNEFFYGWDSVRTGEDYCLSVNNLEGSQATDALIGRFGEIKDTTVGADANIDEADFNICFGCDLLGQECN